MAHSSQKPKLSTYDLVVIGSGPGGQKAAVCAAKNKKTVLVIELQKLGGACLHTGTVPSKALREAALNSLELDTLAIVMKRTRHVIEDESLVIAQQLARNKIEFISGEGSFVSAHEVQIKTPDHTYKVEAKFVIIATGARPRHPKGIQFDNETVFDSDTILDLDYQPKSMAVIGAGVIGCEYASIYARMGISVCLVDVRDQLLASIDQEIVAALLKQFEKSKIRVLLGYETAGLTKDKRKAHLKLHSKSKNETLDLPFDCVLFCSGRAGNVESLKLDAVGIKSDDRGLLKVNSHYQTEVPHIYAVGDIIGFPGLAASAAEQGRLASNHAFLGTHALFPETFPYGIYTIPEISSVGRQEEELKKANIDYVVGIAYYRELARGKIINDEHGFLKLIVDTKTSHLLGVHVIGSGATELVHIGQVAMAFRAKVDFFVDNVFNYPTLAEAYKVAALNAANKIRSRTEDFLCEIKPD